MSEKEKNIECRIAIWFLIPIAALLIFFSIAGLIDNDYVKSIDSKILSSLRINGDPQSAVGPDWLKDAMIEVSALGSGTVIIIVTVLLAGYFTVKGKNFALFFILVSIIGGAVLELALKGVYQRERPPVDLHLISVYSMSFPSGHSMMSVVVYLTLGMMIASIEEVYKVKVYIISGSIILALLIGFTRIYLGVHYPTDVIGGWSLGLFWALICRAVYIKVQNVRQLNKK